jgi:hypothetical protein
MSAPAPAHDGATTAKIARTIPTKSNRDAKIV